MATVGPETVHNFLNVVRAQQHVWAFTDGGNGFPLIERANYGVKAIPFWSTSEKALSQKDTLSEHPTLVSIPLNDLLHGVLPQMARDGVQMGADWIEEGQGFDLPADGAIAILHSTEEITVQRQEEDVTDQEVSDLQPANVNIIPAPASIASASPTSLITGHTGTGRSFSPVIIDHEVLSGKKIKNNDLPAKENEGKPDYTRLPEPGQ